MDIRHGFLWACSVGRKIDRPLEEAGGIIVNVARFDFRCGQMGAKWGGQMGTEPQ